MQLDNANCLNKREKKLRKLQRTISEEIAGFQRKLRHKTL